MNLRLLAIGLLICFSLHAQWRIAEPVLTTRWTKDVSPDNALAEYPRPQMVRKQWQNLNGLWQYAVTPKDAPAPAKFNGEILVPYPIESALSGVKKFVQPGQAVWYKTNIDPAARAKGGNSRILLHFGAVDWQATVFLNKKQVGVHSGGYGNFTVDLTDALRKGQNELLVKVYDPTDQGPNPHGKQVLNPKDIWYTPTTGIWQTVWLEIVPATYIEWLKITPDVNEGKVKVQVQVSGDKNGYTVEAVPQSPLKPVAGSIDAPLVIDARNARLWGPDDPFLYDLTVRLLKNGKVVDEVGSYFGMRKVEIKKDSVGFNRIFLNNNYVFNLGTLDQGFWPDGIYTAPTDAALKFDIEAIKAMGFNTIRKHIKREPDRWYYWCDKLGMLVWQDMINPSFNLSPEAKQAFEQECKENITQLYNHPSIITWTLFNEKWGQYDQERLTRWIKELDPTRLVNGHSGEYLYVNEKLRSPSPNAYIASDLTDVHSYPDPMNAISMEGKARVLGEFGGIGVFIPDHQWNGNNAWGYIQVTPAALKGKYTILNQHLKLLEREGLSASIYTQPFDVEGEQNGLMTYDREVVKIPFKDLRKIHSQLVSIPQNLPAVTAQNADITDPAIKYSEILQRYVDGDKDAAFLRKLIVAAQQVGDKPGIVRATKDYFASLKQPYSKEDLGYVLQLANSTSDVGFAILQDNALQVDRLYGPRKAESRLMNIIYRDEIAPSVTGPNSNPDWDVLKLSIQKYGSAGEEILLRAKTIFFLNANDWNQFAEAANEYFSKYRQYIAADELNQFAWTIFQHCNDKVLLTNAVEWSKQSLKAGDNAAYLDTQANLVYKLGDKDAAIKLQQKATALSADAGLAENLEKMIRGEKTWQ